MIQNLDFFYSETILDFDISSTSVRLFFDKISLNADKMNISASQFDSFVKNIHSQKLEIEEDVDKNLYIIHIPIYPKQLYQVCAIQKCFL